LQTLTTTGAAGAEVTIWYYDPASGQMTSKVYADGKGPTYTYTPAGRLGTRAWARGIVTTYGYNSAGELQSIGYSDGSTPGASYSYDRLGRLLTASGGGSARALTYLGNTNLQTSEAFTGGPTAGTSVSTGYDGLSRRISLQVGQGHRPSIPSATAWWTLAQPPTSRRCRARDGQGLWCLLARFAALLRAVANDLLAVPPVPAGWYSRADAGAPVQSGKFDVILRWDYRAGTRNVCAFIPATNPDRRGC
jgi:YD repeat-containing protein